jgi:hypothetical protein
VLIVLTGELCVQGGATDLPTNIEIKTGFHSLFRHLVEETHCGLGSSVQPSILAVLLQHILPEDILARFFFIAGLENPRMNEPYPDRRSILRTLSNNPRTRRVLLDDIVVMLVVDPLNWERPHLLQPPLHVRDDVHPVEWQHSHVIGPRFDWTWVSKKS